MFHSTADAKKAAVEASQRYWDAYVKARNDPQNSERIMQSVTSRDMAKLDAKEIKEASKPGVSLQGGVKVLDFLITEVNLQSANFRLSGVICANFAEARLVDSDGHDITNPDRADLQATETRYTRASDKSGKIVVQKFGKRADWDQMCGKVRP